MQQQDMVQFNGEIKKEISISTRAKPQAKFYILPY